MNSKQKVNVFLEKANSPTIELIKPSAESSLVNNFINKDGGLQYLCFKTANVNTKVIDLQKNGNMKLTVPLPA